MGETKFKQTEIGKIPEDWEIGHISDLIKVIPGFAIKRKDMSDSGDIPVIKIKNITNQRTVNISDTQYISNELFQNLKEQYKLKAGNIVVAMTGATIGKAGKIPFTEYRFALNQRVAKLISKRMDDLEYVYQIFHSDLIQNNILNYATGAAQQNISSSLIGKIIISIPLENERKKIAKILSDLDSKIELNQQMNKTLEAIGQALFKRWFVDFEFPFDFTQGKPDEKGKPYKSSGGEMADSELGEIPKGWRVGKLCNIVTNIKEALKSGNHLSDRRYVPIDSLPMKHIGMIEDRPSVEAKSSLIAFEKNDILFGAMRAYFHRVNFAPFKGVTRTTTFVLRPNEEHYLSYGLFLLNQDSSVDYANLHSKGSTMPYAVWDNSLAEMPVFVPDEVVLKTYHDLIYPLLQRIAEISDENKKLSNIRDSLLSRLMSGRIRVAY